MSTTRVGSYSALQLRILRDQRLDEWDPDQPRDEFGKFAAAGSGTQEGAVKSGKSAISKAAGKEDLDKVLSSLAGSKTLKAASKAELSVALMNKATDLGIPNDPYWSAAFKASLAGPENETWAESADGEKGMLLDDGKGGKDLVLESGEVVAAPPGVALQSEQGPEKTNYGEMSAGQLFGTAAYKNLSDEDKDQIHDLLDYGDSLSADMTDEIDDVNSQIQSLVEKGEKPAAKSAPAVKSVDKKTVDFGSFEKGDFDMDKAIAESFPPGSTYEEDGVGNWVVTEPGGQQWVAEAQEDGGKHEFKKHDGPTIGDDAEEPNPPANAAKDKAHTEHAKEAREAAKKITAHAAQLRAQLKKDPTNADLAAKVKEAEKAAKAARSAARKAEKATDAKTAEKHAAKAKAHHAKLVGGDDEVGALVVEKAGSKSSGKSASGKTHAVSSADAKALQKKTEKLKEAAEKPHPDSWSKEKVAAKEAAKKALSDHAGASTPDELKAAADAYDKVAQQASQAGSYWGSSYSELAKEMREAATPKETFSVGKGGKHNHDEAPKHSARPVESIKGDVVSEKTFKEHRATYTNTLTASEKKAVLKYSGSAYTQINGDLRKGKPPDETARAIDKAIEKAPAPRDMLVHRGVGGTKAKEVFGSLQPGDEYVEKAYSSTSAGGSAAFGGEYELHITVPKGYPVAPIPSHHPHEREYLLRRNTRFRVTKREQVGGKTKIHVTVIHDKKEE